MPSTIDGLPLHPLIVHATVVLVPLAALLVLLAAGSTRFRAWAGPLPLGASILALVLTPLTTATGDRLESQLPHSALIEKHDHLAGTLILFTGALFVLALAQWWVTRPGAKAGRNVVVVVCALAALASAATVVQVVRIGHSGADAAWHDYRTAT